MLSAAPDVAHCTVTVDTPTVATSATGTATLTSVDAEGRTIALGGWTVAFSNTGGTSSLSWGSVTDNHDGTYTCVYTAGGSSGTATTLTCTIGGSAVTTTMPTITVSNVSVWLLEDFSTYSSTANFLSNPRNIYSLAGYAINSSTTINAGEASNPGQIVLDQSVGYAAGSLAQSLRYDYPSTSAADYDIGVNLVLPSNTTELWLEVAFRLQNGFSVFGPLDPDHNGDQGISSGLKFLFGRTDVDRFALILGPNQNYSFAPPGHEGDQQAEFGDWTALADGNWHLLRWHMKTGSSGLCVLVIDGTTIKDWGTVSTTASYIYGIALGRNMNSGVTNPESLWWGRVRGYNSDPGWGF